MKHFRNKLLILFLLILLAALAGMALPCAAGAEQGGNVTPELHAVAETESDSVVSQVFVNMINRSIERMNAGGDSEEEDPSLAEYPMEERPLAEYGDSPRLRVLDEGGDGGEPNYLVYRESILVIPLDEPADVRIDDQILLLVTCVDKDTDRRIVAARRIRDGEEEGQFLN